MKVLITGCGRSGTAYAAKVFQAIGLDVRHEEMGVNGTSDWRLAPWKVPNIDLALHLIRPMRQTVESLQTINDDSWALIGKRIDLTGNKIEDALAYWVKWNELASKNCHKTVTLDWMVRFAKRLGVSVAPVNSRVHKEIPVKEILNANQRLFFRAIKMEAEYF